jgi:hypothetical protein
MSRCNARDPGLSEVCVVVISKPLIRFVVFENGLFRYWTHASLRQTPLPTIESNHKVANL